MEEGNQWAWRQSNKNWPIWITGRKDTEKKWTEPQGLSTNNKRCIIHIIRVSEKEEKEYGAERVYEDWMAEHFPNWAKHTNLQIQKAEQIQTEYESKEIHARKHNNQTSESKDKKYWKQVGKWHIISKRNNDSNDSRFLIRNYGGQQWNILKGEIKTSSGKKKKNHHH